MVICPYSAHITMANFSPIFSSKINRLTAQLARLMFWKIFSASSRHLFALKYKIFVQKMSHGYIYTRVYITMAKFSLIFEKEN